MPMIRYKNPTQQTHGSGCWRWATHWRCCVGLVEELAEASNEMLEALRIKYSSDKTTDYPGMLMDAADTMIAVLAKVEGDST